MNNHSNSWPASNGMKKVLIFSLAYFPHVGGAEVAVKEITDRIRDIEFHMVTLRFSRDEPAEEKIGNVQVHRILTSNSRINKFLFQYLAYKKAAVLHAELHFDAIWAVMAHSTGVPAALFKRKFPTVGYVLNLQEGDPPERIERTMLPVWPWFSQAFTSADIVQPLSNFLAEWARRRGFTGPIEIIPNGVNARHFSQSVPEDILKKTREEFGKYEGDAILVSTSRLVTKNALDDVIRTMKHLPHNVSFINFGFGPELETLKALAKAEGVSERVRLEPHPGVPELPKYLQASDMFIRPSRSEGFGISFVEAMAAGLPVIATQEGGIADFLFDAKRNPDKPTTGWAVDKDSPEQIAKAVKDILAHPADTALVVDNARRMVFEKYDWNDIALAVRQKVFTKLFARS